MVNSTTENQLYIVATRTLERVAIQFMPESLDFTTTVNEEEVQIIGRSHPKRHYSGGGDSVSFEIQFHASEELREDVIRKCKLLRSFATGSRDQAKQPVVLIWGDLFKEEIWSMVNCDYTLEQFDPGNGMLPCHASMRLSFKLDPKVSQTNRQLKWR